jgi:CopG family nickel-responsive transcriptional regulator
MHFVILKAGGSMSVARVAISLERELLGKIEKRMGERVYRNRSKFISDIIRDWLLKEGEAGGPGTRVGTICVVYDHHTRGVLDRITGIQHGFGTNVIATMHVHISHDECLEVITARGRAKRLQKIADAIASVRGVSTCRLSIVR